MSEAPKRRWFQFRLSSLLWLTLVVALSIFAIRERRERQRVEEQNEQFFLQAAKEYSGRQDLIRKLDREIEKKMSEAFPNSNGGAIKQYPGDTDHPISAHPVNAP